MADRTITAANAIYMLAISGLYPAPQRLQGYSADAAFETDAVEPVEVQMGVDGHMSAGFVPTVTMQTITLQADSLSHDIFENWLQAEKVIREKLIASAVISLPATGRKYILTRGVLSSGMSIPGTRKVLQPRAWRITWEQVNSAAV